MNLEHLEKLLTANVAAVYFENPSYLGYLETKGAEIAELAHKQGALTVVSVDLSLLA